MTTGKRIIGIIEGDSVPDIFIPSLVELYTQGCFPFDKLVTFYTWTRINQATTGLGIIRVSVPSASV